MEKHGNITEDTPLSEHDKGDQPQAKQASDTRFDQDLARRSQQEAEQRLAKAEQK
jgi:hypothetical protein